MPRTINYFLICLVTNVFEHDLYLCVQVVAVGDIALDTSVIF